MQPHPQTVTTPTPVTPNRLEAWFAPPAPATNPQAIDPLLPPAGDTLFAFTDIEIIASVGPLTWAQRKGAVQWEDQPLTWSALPGIIRSNLITDVVEAVQQPLQYLVPLRHLGRVVTFALLPADPETPDPIRVEIAQPARRPEIDRQGIEWGWGVDTDPPVPFLTLGLASAEAQQMHGHLVRQILSALPATPASVDPETLIGLLQAIARTGAATVSEVLYYLTQLRALATGSWRYLAENQGLLAVEQLVRQSVTPNPARAQQLAYAHLVEGRPIDWGDADPLRVTVRPPR